MTDLAGKTFVITGANSGIGKITARELAKRGGHVILACRSADKTQAVIDELKQETGNDKIEFLALDLSDLDSVRRSAEQLLARNLPIHGLINNAGFARGLKGPKATTKQGFEATFATNHLGHYLFTRMLLDRIKQTKGARIVNVSSKSHYSAKKIDWDALRSPTKSLGGLDEYAVSKLANVLFTKELARRLEGSGVTTYAVHPGVVATNVWRGLPAPLAWVARKFMLTPEQGAHSTINCATSPQLATETGNYYDADGSQRRPARLASDEQLAKQLWTKSAEWTGLPV
ncbi:MAG: SDR family oxidoreductase [Kofleriaceae bacterium]|nr:SDR family oxidoreductase [Kofleriaceae bacterium]